jgi:NAD-dependent deacetylase
MHHPVGSNDFDEALERAACLVRAARQVAVLTGAGISAESGLATFRGAGGLWEGHRVEDVATPRAFAGDPGLVWRFYNLRRANLAKVQPNPGHHALVDLEKRFADGFTLITQNVDGLHQSAGSKNVLEIHGALRRVRCTGCARIEDRGVQALPDLPKCRECGALLRPDVVWFEEMLPAKVWAGAELAVQHCQCLLVVGTSAVVYPAAGLIDTAQGCHAKVIEVNPTATAATSSVDIALQGPSGKILPDLLKRL